MAKKTEAAERAVVICTVHRGVFFGYTTETNDEIMATKVANVKKVRMCVYWDDAAQGVISLAAVDGGPTKGCRITKAAPSVVLNDVTAVFDCSPDAAAKWEARPWA